MYLTRKTKKKFTNKIRKHKNIFYKTTGKLEIKKQNFIFFDFLYEQESVRRKTPVISAKMRTNKTRERKLNKMLKENSDAVVISHNPPFGYVDKIHSGKHVGSKILLKAIRNHQPKLVLCGHIHEAKGKTKIGKTPVYNLGWHGNYEVIEI